MVIIQTLQGINELVPQLVDVFYKKPIYSEIKEVKKHMRDRPWQRYYDFDVPLTLCYPRVYTPQLLQQSLEVRKGGS